MPWQAWVVVAYLAFVGAFVTAWSEKPRLSDDEA
jgi:hypothetical protein